MNAEHWLVRGRVQGVGYREWLVGIARAERVAGWCRNRDDGTVEVVVQGPQVALDRLASACATGPVHAVVREVSRASWSGAAPPDGFERR